MVDVFCNLPNFLTIKNVVHFTQNRNNKKKKKTKKMQVIRKLIKHVTQRSSVVTV